jgi:hypothetical protein
MKLTEKLLLFFFILALPLRLWGIEYGFFIYAIDAFSILLILYYLLFNVNKKKYNGIQLLLLSHSFWIIISSLLAVLIYKSELSQVITGVLQLLSYNIFLIYFVEKIQDDSYLNLILRFIFSTGIVIVPLSLINFYTNSFLGIDFIFDFIKLISIGNLELDDNYLKLNFWIRNSSFAGEPNFLGMYFVFLLQLVLVMVRSFLLKQIIAIILLIAIISTFSRAAIICGLIVYLIWTFYFFNRTSLNGKISVLVIFLCSFSFFYLGGLETNDDIENVMLSVNSRSFSSDNERLKIFNQALNIFSEHPLGVGSSNYSVYANRLYGELGEPNPHNSFLTTLVEEGLIGIGLMVLLFIHLIMKLFRFTNIYFIIGFIVFIFPLFINDFYKILGYKVFIVFSFYIFLYNIKYLNKMNSY